MSFFESISFLPEDPILNLPILFSADPRQNKINLGVGSYKDAEGQSFVLNAVKKAEELLLKQHRNKEYLPIAGDRSFVQETLKLVFGDSLLPDLEGRLFGVQSIGGTGALRIAADFFENHLNKIIYIPEPSWPNHRLIFSRARLKVETYPYYDLAAHKIDFSALCRTIQTMPAGSAILLQASCHNPTGMDPTEEQWKELSALIKKQGVFPLFDFAYQGFGSGVEEDAMAVRLFAKDGHELFTATSYSKNMGLYGERAGVLSCCFSDQKIVAKASTHLKQIIRSNYSNPPLHGAQIASIVLQTPELKQEWLKELQSMQERIEAMRLAFIAGLLAKRSPLDFSFMKEQKGMFSYTGLNNDQVRQLKEEHAIYLPDGRINVAGLNAKNLDSVIDAILSVIVT